MGNFYRSALGEALGRSCEPVDKREGDSLRSSRHFGFSVQDLLKCHSLRMWISAIVAAAFTRVKRGEMHTGDIYVCAYINYLKEMSEFL